MSGTELVWRALADPTRRRLLDLLRDRPRTTGDLAARFDLSRFAVMKHLTVLEEARLVVVRRKGRERWNYLNAVPLRRAYERWMAPYAEEAAASMLSLKDAAEGRRRTPMDIATTDGVTELGTLEIEHEVEIDAPRERVFEFLTVRTGEWFVHRLVAGSPIRVEPGAGGAMYEDWGDGNGAVWGRFTAYQPPSYVRVAGEWGVAGPVMIVTTFKLEDRDGGTLLQGSWRIMGEIDPSGLSSYQSVTAASMQSVKRVAEAAA